MNFLMFKLVLEKAEEPEIKCQHQLDHGKSKRVPEKHLFVLYWLCQSLDCVDIMVIWFKFAHSGPFSSRIAKTSMFTLAISCLTISNLPWFMDCQSPAPAARDSTWRDERGWRESEAASQFFFGLPVYFKLMNLFYTFAKALGQRFDIFSSHWPRFIFL